MKKFFIVLSYIFFESSFFHLADIFIINKENKDDILRESLKYLIEISKILINKDSKFYNIYETSQENIEK